MTSKRKSVGQAALVDLRLVTYNVEPIFQEYSTEYPLKGRDFPREFVGGGRWQI